MRTEVEGHGNFDNYRALVFQEAVAAGPLVDQVEHLQVLDKLNAEFLVAEMEEENDDDEGLMGGGVQRRCVRSAPCRG